MQSNFQQGPNMYQTLNYPLTAPKRQLEEVFLFGLIGILVIIGALYFIFYLAVSHIVNPSSDIQSEPPIQRTIVV
jgi:hypothetical protein